MRRSSSVSPLNANKSRRTRSEDLHLRSRRSSSQDYMNKRIQAWLIHQEREGEHERLKQNMILQYELKREGMLRSKESTRKSSYRSTSRSRDSRSQDRRPSPRHKVMSQKLASDGNTPLFKGSSGVNIDALELHRIKVNIHINMPGATNSNKELERDIVNPDEVTLKRREDEGVKPIFEWAERKFPDCLKSTEEPPFRTVRTARKINSPSRRSKHLSPSKRSDKTTQEASLCWDEGSRHYSENKNNRRSYSTNDRRKDDDESRYRKNGRRDRLHENSGHSSSHRTDRKYYSEKRRSSRERSYSSDSKRHNSEYDRLSRHDRDGYSHREYRRRSRDRREKQRSVENRDRERSRERKMSSLPHYIEPIPIPVYYGNFPPRPVMMDPMISMREPGLLLEPTILYPPGFMPSIFYRESLTPNPQTYFVQSYI